MPRENRSTAPAIGNQVFDRIIKWSALEQGLVDVRLRPTEQDRVAVRLRARATEAAPSEEPPPPVFSREPPQCRAGALSYPPTGARWRRTHHPARMGQQAGLVASDIFARRRCARWPAARHRPLPDARMCGRECSMTPPKRYDASACTIVNNEAGSTPSSSAVYCNV